MTWFVTSLRANPELAIFLTLALGLVIGRLRFGTFSLGNVVGTLLAGVSFLAGLLASTAFAAKTDDLGMGTVRRRTPTLKRELVKDFYATLRGYESYDSRPATEGACTSDYGITFALGWVF